MNIRPLHDRIIVERLEEETTTAAGIIIPDSAKEKPQQGTAVAVGKGKSTEDGKVLPLDVKQVQLRGPKSQDPWRTHSERVADLWRNLGWQGCPDRCSPKVVGQIE